MTRQPRGIIFEYHTHRHALFAWCQWVSDRTNADDERVHCGRDSQGSSMGCTRQTIAPSCRGI